MVDVHVGAFVMLHECNISWHGTLKMSTYLDFDRRKLHSSLEEDFYQSLVQDRAWKDAGNTAHCADIVRNTAPFRAPRSHILLKVANC